jgi:arylsulfatase
LILFMSDNGGKRRVGTQWAKPRGDPTKARSQWFCGQSWAHLQNTPFRLYKHYNHEGGIATAVLIGTGRPGLRPRASYAVNRGLGDIMATVMEVGGAAYPKEFKGQAIQAMEGRSLTPAFANKSIERDALYWEARRQRGT